MPFQTVNDWVSEKRKNPEFGQPPASRQHFDVWTFPTPGGALEQKILGTENFEPVGRTLRRIEGAVLWWVGDWLAYGARYGDAGAAAEATGYAYQTARNAAVVSRAFELYRRRDNLSWKHHQDVAALPAAEQDALLDWCLTGERRAAIPRGPRQ